MSPTTTRPQADPSVPPDGTGSGGDDDRSGYSPGPWEIVAGLTLVVSALVILVVLMAGGGDDDDDVSAPSGTLVADSESAVAAGPDAGGVTGQDGEPGVPEGASETLAATEPLASDSFARPDNPDSMGEAAPGQIWIPGAGEWGIIDDQAYVSGPGDASVLNLVVLAGVEMFQGTVQADISRVTNGSGLLFRYQGPFNYFTIMPTPDSVSWRVQKVVGGERELVGVLPFAPVSDGTTVTVQLQARRIEVYFDGQPWGTFVDEDLVFASAVGLVVSGSESGTARIDNFQVGQIGDGSMPGLADVEPGGGGE